MDIPALRARAALLALPLAAAISIVEPVVGWGFTYPEDPAARLAEIGARPDDARTIGYAFVVSQFLFLVGALALASRIRARGALLATIGGALAALGAFGHLVFGGAALVSVKMAAPSADASEMALLYARAFDGGPILPFMILGLAGFLFGFLLLFAGAWRSNVLPRWPALAAVAALVAEFALGSFEWGALLARAGLTIAVALLVWPELRRGAKA